MANELQRGQKADITKNNPALKKLNIALNWQADSSIELDTSAFLLGDNGKVADESDFVFYSNPAHSSQSVRLANNQLEIDLLKVPSNVNKIAITLTIYSRHNFSQVKNAVINVNDLITFKFGENLSSETAIVVAEIYRYKGEWKFNAVGAGFNGGLAALCKNFGVDVSDDTSAPPPTVSQPKPQPAAPPQSTTPVQSSATSTPSTENIRKPMRLDPPSAPTNRQSISSSMPPPSTSSTSDTSKRVDLKKVELKKGEKVSLVKTGATLGEIVINLNWTQPQKMRQSGGFLSRIFGGSQSDKIDLDLACLYELQDGNKGVVQALGKCFGSLEKPPYIALDGDDRTGAKTTGETIRVNGKYVDKIKRILVFTFIYEGVANWQQADGVVTVKCPGSPDIIVKMDEYGSDLPNCGIALLENQGGTFSVEKIVKFYQSTRYLDQDFNWGLRWTSGRK